MLLVVTSSSSGGERGIRTPGASQLNGFQDRRNRPLCHLSERKNITEISFFQLAARFYFPIRKRVGMLGGISVMHGGVRCGLPIMARRQYTAPEQMQ